MKELHKGKDKLMIKNMKFTNQDIIENESLSILRSDLESVDDGKKQNKNSSPMKT